MSVTLSVPEILQQVMDGFQIEIPALFSFGQDFSSSTAALGDTITARIAHLPATADGSVSGFAAAPQNVTTLVEDVPVTLNQLRMVTVKIPGLTALNSKVYLGEAAIKNVSYALGKFAVDAAISMAAVSVSNNFLIQPQLANLDSLELLRGQLNTQKIYDRGRYLLLNSAIAGSIGLDDRIRSELFVGQKNGDQGFREWQNVAGFNRIWEYPDVLSTFNGLGGIAWDKRLFAFAVRSIKNQSDVAEQLGVPKSMEFYKAESPTSKLNLTGVMWQEQGTGTVFLSVAILFGLGVGNQGGAIGSMTDNAGCLIRTQ